MTSNFRKTHEQFLIDLRTKQPKIFNSIKIIGEYVRNNTPILIENKYGVCSVKPVELLSGKTPTIMSAINKTEYFKNELKDKQFKLFDSIQIIGKYEGNQKPILIQNKYGNCLIRPNNLLSGYAPSIQSAINKNEYFTKQAIEIHGDKYDYSKVEYINYRTKIKIKSSEGYFLQTPSSHLAGRGCPTLGKMLSTFSNSEYAQLGLNSKTFDSFKIYIIRCWNDNKSEIFYKIGKTFNKINTRFHKGSLPYNYKIVKEIRFDNTKEGGVMCCQAERDLQNQFKSYKYIPKVKFKGMYECFKDIFTFNLK